jgi:UTP--glucose-1-phosphate uridylyltransferase
MPHPIKKAIVPAAGLGTRLLPATKSQPKEMLPVGRKPVVQYVVEELQAAGLTQMLIITGRRKRAIEDHFDPDSTLLSALEQAGNEALLSELSYIQRNSRFFYTRQSSPKGLGHAVSLGAEFVDDDDCVVALGDSMITGEDPAAPLRAMMQTHRDLDAAAIIAVEQVAPDETHRYGIATASSASRGASPHPASQ